jgi:hypothetical protein
MRQFGSWDKALLAAGITAPKYAHGLRGCIGFLQTLRDALDRRSANVLPQALKSCAVYYFGSLQKAVGATKGKQVYRPRLRLKPSFAECTAPNRALGISRHDVSIWHWYVPPRSISEAGGRHYMVQASIPTCIMSITSGPEQSESDKVKDYGPLPNPPVPTL